MMFVVLAVILTISYQNYQNVKVVLQAHYQTQQQLIERGILDAVRSTDTISRIVDEQFSEKMKERSEVLLQKYRVNHDLSRWDLKQLKKQFGDYDIYVIDSDLVVVSTTFEKDLGLDFKRFSNFARLLRARLDGNQFAADRLDVSINTGLMKKYSYMPTPDHRYLLELSIDTKNEFPTIDGLDIISVADRLTKEYSSVDDILVYKFGEGGNIIKEIRHLSVTTKPLPLPEATQAVIRDVISGNHVRVTIEKEADLNDRRTRKFIPYLAFDVKGGLDWWNSYVIEITYNQRDFYLSLMKQRNLFLYNVLIAVLAFGVLVITVDYLFRRVEYMAFHDLLTGLPNRKLFEGRMTQAFKNAKTQQKGLAVMFIDLDNFKDINDEFGHDVGDKLICAVADRLKGLLRNDDSVCRMGGDEFTILLTDVGGPDDAAAVAARILDVFNEPLVISGRQIVVKPSIGVSVFPEDGDMPETLIKRADDAMYQAKKRGKGNYQFYVPCR